MGIDNLGGTILLPNWTTTGAISRQTESGGNAYARLDTAGSITSAAFTLDANAQSLTLRAETVGNGTFTGQFSLYLLSGTGFTTSTTLTLGSSTTASWQTFHYAIAPSPARASSSRSRSTTTASV